MYSINGTSFSAYGFIPTKQDGSDLALTGFLDMPARLGKCFHSWPSLTGIEPYTSASEIRFGGRDLSLLCVVKGANREDCLIKIKDFSNAVSSWTGLVPLVSDFGTYQVYIKDAIVGEYLADGLLKVNIQFREPLPVVSGTLLNGYSDYGIDGTSWDQLGGVLMSIGGDRFNRTATKNIDVTAYQYEGYYLGKTSESKLTMQLFIKQPTYAAFKDRIGNLNAIWTQPGERNLIVKDDLQRKVFACNGFTVSRIRNDDGYYGFVNIDLIESQPSQVITYLGDNLGNYITDNSNNKILIKWQ